ncbi:PREDICTED: putative DNA (cytosine-5)-methyltransferase CMT1 [Camelina sativa]|uniref:DNA (cytosine-5-)-methyltransferase n=1 Tax=Camelina sativa TaxID=90675 RepID=A0ABM1QGE3_CAMSA|nr:PREDICTED: putative DNA (cytosine-5)-methyltransferase CMT1 [Camelina sativa]
MHIFNLFLVSLYLGVLIKNRLSTACTSLEPNRVLSVREIARLQGFPGCYRLHGPVKQKHIQVGNAVAVPIGVALGYAYGIESQTLCDDKPVIDYPFIYPE